MRVLLTNDDGPPSVSSPFLVPFIQLLQDRLGWQVTVCIPHTQNSWMGKSFQIADTVSSTYLDPVTGIITNERKDSNSWLLLSCTPAACVNIALHNVYSVSDFDLLLSGPNLGRNAGTGSSLSSGTMGYINSHLALH